MYVGERVTPYLSGPLPYRQRPGPHPGAAVWMKGCPQRVVGRLSSFPGPLVQEKPSGQMVCPGHKPGRHEGSAHDDWGCGSQGPPVGSDIPWKDWEALVIPFGLEEQTTTLTDESSEGKMSLIAEVPLGPP